MTKHVPLLRWETVPEVDPTSQAAWSGIVGVGLIGKLPDHLGGKWFWKIEGIRIPKPALDQGTTNSMAQAKIEIERRWVMWLNCAGLMSTDSALDPNGLPDVNYDPYRKSEPTT